MERFCADPVARAVNHPPHPAGAVVSWSAGQPVPLERNGVRWAGFGEGKNLLQMPKLLP